MRLREIELFKGFTEEQLSKIQKIKREKVFAAREPIVKMDDETREFYLLESGRVQVEIPLDDGKNILSILHPVSIFGEVGLLDESRRSASVVALDESTILVIDNKQFLALLDDDKDMGYKFYRSLAHILFTRLNSTSEQLTFCRITLSFNLQ